MSPQRSASPYHPWSLRPLGGLGFVWAGLVVGISFIEAPVKFTAPSLPLSVGLDVGRHVFAALNRAELLLALASVGLAWSARPRRSTEDHLPNDPAILAHTPMSTPGKTLRDTFMAPSEPGAYRYICTYPGHDVMMQGTMTVT